MKTKKCITQLVAAALAIVCFSSYATEPASDSELRLERQQVVEHFNMDLMYVDKNHSAQQVDKILSYFSDPDQSHVFSPKVDYSPLYGTLSARDYFTAISKTVEDVMSSVDIIYSSAVTNYSPENTQANLLIESLAILYNYDKGQGSLSGAEPRYTYEFLFVDNSTKIQALLIYSNPLAPARWGR
jgi:hypothetical protein